ncbi:hypothetical protein [Pseudoalteromonas luteoviolacea]|uniref:Uncharacterized protein n=1 Tax=Pseudoalteromonas luteoviolacea S4060-1 TaxID=1365257 RepID=A0A161YJR6_9GAMM|nr:hypothetical protein [Pseudoalteromonas luteoviolacea]KZN61530.1 hypothetical protein N478_05505 [Pseudoalteromonas luteoviolacea S4060-1]
MKLKKRSLKHLSEHGLRAVNGGGGGSNGTVEPPQAMGLAIKPTVKAL